MEFVAPSAPDAAVKYMPQEETFAEGVWKILQDAIDNLAPSVAEGASKCLSVLCVAVLLSLLQNYTSHAEQSVNLVGTLLISGLLLQSSHTMIRLGVETVQEISHYGNLLIPVMSGALAAQGGSVSAASFYTATAVFSSLLSSAVAHIIAPALYVYILLSVVQSAAGDKTLSKAISFIKWAVTWALKISLYVFTGYMTISGAISGSTDAAALKAAKLTISGMVPVVGGILADASDSVLLSAGIMKNAAGIYGIFVFLSLLVEPFLKIGVQYLLLKITAGFCEGLEVKSLSALLKCFSSSMGLALAMTASVSLMLMISVVCFMKGIA